MEGLLEYRFYRLLHWVTMLDLEVLEVSLENKRRRYLWLGGVGMEKAIATFHLRGSMYVYFPSEMRNLDLLEMVLCDVVYLPWKPLDEGVKGGLLVNIQRKSDRRFWTVSMRRLRARGCIDVYPCDCRVSITACCRRDSTNSSGRRFLPIRTYKRRVLCTSN
jgi:hypothetical protein